MRVVSQENFATDKFILMEIATSGTLTAGDQVELEDIPELRFNDGIVNTNAIQVFTADQLSVTPGGVTVIPQAEINRCVLVLSVLVAGKTQERIVRIPMFDLVSSSNGGYYRTLNNLPILVTKSFVEVTTALATADIAFVFGFHYYDASGKPRRRAAVPVKG